MDHETVERYKLVASRLITRYARETEKAWEDDPGAFIQWMLKLGTSLAPSTWRQYRRAIEETLGHRIPEPWMQRLGAFRAHKPKTQRLSTGNRPKKLPLDDLKSMLHAAQEKRSKWVYTALTCLLATLVTGLRPVEWWDAELEGDWLLVRNAKYSTHNGRPARAFAPYRHLWIGELRDAERNAIQTFLEVIKTLDYQAAKAAMDLALYRLQKGLWPRRKHFYSLYSARHQCIANAKRDGSSSDALAALVGHLSRETARRHYGRSQAGHTGSGRRPSALPADSDVETVAELNAHRDAAEPDEPSPGPGP